MASRKKARLLGVTAVAASSVILLSACATGASSTSTDSAGGDDINIALMMASAGNGFNQGRLEGAEEMAEELGNVTITPFDGQFSADEQFAQIQNIAQSGEYDGIFIEPFDGVSLAGAFPLVSEIPIVSINTPIGSDYNDYEPQVNGVIQTIGDPPGELAAEQAEFVVDHCADIDPCKVVIMVGYLSTALDVTRMEAYKEVLGEHSNIEIVAESEGGWDRDQSLETMSNILQANPDVNVFLTPGDQMAFGAQIALENAGIDPVSVFIAGMGGTEDAVQAVRDGTWDMTGLWLPKTAGRVGVQTIVDYLGGEEVPTVVSFSELNPDIPMWADADVLAGIPDFTGEWNG